MFRIIFVFGEVFRYRLRLNTIRRKFYIVVQYIGPAAEASKFMYEVELSGEQKEVLIRNRILEEHVNVDEAFETGKCITLDYDLVRNMGKVSYSVKVSRTAS